jgi:inner membrane protein
MLSRAFLDRGARGTPWLIVAAANIPDLDFLVALPGTIDYLHIHRGYTHSFLFLPLVALVPWLVLKFLFRYPFGVREYLAAMVGVLSHLLLDWTNVYGIRLLKPFSERWLRLDQTDIIDPWIFAILLSAVALPGLVRLVSDEIGGRAKPVPGPSGVKRGWAWAALTLLLGYELLRYTSHERALAILNSHLYMDRAPVRVTATPDRLNPLRWRGVVEGDDFVYEVPVQVTGDFDPGAGHVEYPAGTSRYLDIARQTKVFQAFEKFDQLPYYRLLVRPDGMRVELLDLRFGTIRDPGLLAWAEIEQNGFVKEATFAFGLPIGR